MAGLTLWDAGVTGGVFTCENSYKPLALAIENSNPLPVLVCALIFIIFEASHYHVKKLEWPSWCLQLFLII